MHWLVSVGLFIAVAYGAGAMLGDAPSDASRSWLFWSGLILAVVSSCAMKISGLQRITSLLRDLLIGAWLGWGLRKLGLDRPWVLRAFRFIGYDASPDAQGQELQRRVLSWSRLNDALLVLGWFGAVVGVALVWASR
ncbi:hypothetical protein GXW71_04175 [Roseomonas hellenica]|uniref:Uncharacterized protein n=1 Tax=Plastoroseomonas hellenica TaxID=2687306 RepID=A0ABS5ETD5_9PROT|nr:hypothetical protein [Plastoroseomonas hellenica]MBR0663547.1 hypothetical protein [Plastoroseomonas hellenica]